MKQLLKHPSHFIKLVALLLFFSVFNCQKEDINTPNQTQELSSVSYTVTSLSKLTKLQPVVENIKKLSPKTNTYNRGFGDFLPLENIDTTRVIQYTDTTGYSTYTFKIESDDETSINFENLYLLETEQGYIGYILRYEPDENWYYSEVNYTPEGDHVFNIPTYQGDITKYSLEREVIWSTKEENMDRTTHSMRGEFGEVCVYSTFQECSNDYLGNPGGAWHPRGPDCEGPYKTTRSSSCQIVWSSGGSGNEGDGDNGDPSGGGNNNDCITTGTTIINQQPMSGVGTDCAPNKDAGILLTEEETLCTVSSHVIAQMLNSLQINSFTQMELQNYIEDPDNACQIGDMALFLQENNYSPQAKIFAIETFEVFSYADSFNSNNQVDYEQAILRLTNHLRSFGNIEDEIYADYIDSLIPDFNTMTINEVREIYSQVKTTCKELTFKYAEAIFTPIVTDLVIPIVTYALFNATANTAMKLLQKIPVSMVLQGARLNKIVTKLSQLGSAGTQGTHIRELHGTTVSKAQELFLTITKNAISTTNNNGVITANMGNGNYITFRTVSSPLSPNVIATIDLNFPQLFSEIVKLKFYP